MNLESMEPRRLLANGNTPVEVIELDTPGEAVVFTQVTMRSGNRPMLVTSLDAPGGLPAKLTSTGTLYIHGTDARDRIAIQQNDHGDIEVLVNGALQASGVFSAGPNASEPSVSGISDHFDASAVKRIRIAGGAGRDLVTVRVPPRISATLADSTSKDVLTRFTRRGTIEI